MKFIIYFIIFILYTEHKIIKDYEEQQKEDENGI